MKTQHNQNLLHTTKAVCRGKSIEPNIRNEKGDITYKPLSHLQMLKR